MAHRIPIHQDDLSFEERQNKVWEDMEKDMERRRQEWEDEIERMRSDFFQLKPNSNGKLDALTDKISVKDTMDDTKTVIEKDHNGRPVFRARFNVHEYKPEEVNVKMDADKLIVYAKHEEKDGHKSVSREFSREVNIPKEVDPMALQCTISKDGILTAEAPMPVPGYQQITDSGYGTQRIIPTATPLVSSPLVPECPHRNAVTNRSTYHPYLYFYDIYVAKRCDFDASTSTAILLHRNRKYASVHQC
ncbi:hypothetical protein FSP39_007248 [Pinctada imbricata]|uniref:SHSP domain-containing protein n=1 Tax=Pinctada imbricata TaxID=66713 RepID=A0AA88YI55_PINIB|nr:hypothetical protein FSP39_007248 [Pinctada imbricata]